jgi:UDP:flavonoid glycosyltransferase YjiC (YdhE family)
MLPYLRLAQELEKRGHYVTLSAPQVFENLVRESKISHYTIQGTDDIGGMLAETDVDTKDLLQWTRRVIQQQFKELIPLLNDHDVLVASNTEFAAPTIAEYCKKPYVRTAYGPFIPGKKIPPPVFPFPNPPAFLTPILWGVLNSGLNLMVKKIINAHRFELRLPPIRDQGEHAPASALNYLMYSPNVGDTDENWKYPWDIGGYIFNDNFPYDAARRLEFMEFVAKDDKPILFFTLGSCNSNAAHRFAGFLFELCKKHGYKLVIGSGWAKPDEHLKDDPDFFRLDKTIPHNVIFPLCTAIIHHGGVGTTHSAARSGKPQMIVPLLLDQWYWAHRTKLLGLGPGAFNIKSRFVRQPKWQHRKRSLERKLLDLMTNPAYKAAAEETAGLVRREQGVENACLAIEKHGRV